MNATLETDGTATTTRRTARRTRRPLTLLTAAGVAALALTCSSGTPALARQGVGSEPGSAAWQPAPVTVARIDRQVIRCDTGEGNLGGAGARAPLTLPFVATCNPSAPVAQASAAQARQLEHDLLR
jgi:hypothetical protein